jgi:hypothetical protein
VKPLRIAASIAAAGVVITAGLLATRGTPAGADSQPVAAHPGGPVVVVETAAAAPAQAATARQAVPAAAAPRAGVQPAPDSTGWPAAPPPRTLPQAPQDSCDSQRIPHPTGFFAMRGSGTDRLTPNGGEHAVYVDHAPVQVVCQNATSSGDLALEIDIFPYGGDASHFTLTVGPSGLVIVSAGPGHGAQTVGIGRRIAGWPGGCGTVSAAGIRDTLCFSGSGQLTHAELHEQSTVAGGDTRQLDATFDA